MKTVFGIDGFGWSGALPLTKIVQKLCVGARFVQVPYDNSDKGNNLASITEAVKTLDIYLNDPLVADDEKVVVGISEGDQVANAWQRTKGPSSTVKNLSFVNLADPENRFTGVAVVSPQSYGGGYGGCGIPVDTRFPTTVFSRQWDGVTDYPNKPNWFATWLAVVNATAGIGIIHMNYLSVGLDDPGNKSFTPLVNGVPGNITYIWSPTTDLPMLGKADAFTKWFVELCYDRPVKL